MPLIKPVEFVGSSKDDLSAFPVGVKTDMGHALFVAQTGGKAGSAKPLTGASDFKGAGVLEIIDDHDGNTYRAVYTVRFEGVIYVLHAFQKKSKRRIATPKPEIDLIQSRLKLARNHYEIAYAAKATG